MPQSSIPHILSVLIFLPLVGALVLMCLPRPKDLSDHHDGHGAHHDPTPSHEDDEDMARTIVNWVAIGVAAITLILSIALFREFNPDFFNPQTRTNMQFIEDAKWFSIGTIDIHYRVGVDGISLLLVMLTAFLTLLCVIFSINTKQRVKEFMIFLLLLETGMIGVFCALDLVLFYFFWEAMLIPMYFLIGIFGHERRIYAAIKFFLYTFVGSVLMLVAIVAVYNIAGSFDVIALSNPLSAAGRRLGTHDAQVLLWLFGAFSLAFMIKVPMFPFHTWLPDAHVEAPTAGSAILAGVMLKMGTYGFVRFCLPMFPAQALQMAPLFITLAIIGIIYGSMVAAVQTDAKKLVAYSSVAHLGFVILGIFSFTQVGLMGALVQNINHGISTPMLFFIVGMLYERRHTREISKFGGLKKVVPLLSTMLMIATFASIAVPFFNGFVGEFPILVGSWLSTNAGPVPTLLAGTGMILAAVYMLVWYQKLMLGPITHEENRHLKDLTQVEWMVLLPLTVIIFWFGLGSPFWTSRMDSPVKHLLQGGKALNNDEMPIGPVLMMKSQREAKDHPAMIVEEIEPEAPPQTPQPNTPRPQGAPSQPMPQQPMPMSAPSPNAAPGGGGR